MYGPRDHFPGIHQNGGVQFLRKKGDSIMKTNRSFLKFVAVILFVLAAIFLFAVDSIETTTDLGLIAVGLAAWALG